MIIERPVEYPNLDQDKKHEREVNRELARRNATIRSLINQIPAGDLNDRSYDGRRSADGRRLIDGSAIERARRERAEYIRQLEADFLESVSD